MRITEYGPGDPETWTGPVISAGDPRYDVDADPGAEISNSITEITRLVDAARKHLDRNDFCEARGCLEAIQEYLPCD